MKYNCFIVTGCAGFIGFHYCLNLLKNHKKFIILGIDNLNNYYETTIKEERLKILKKNKNFFFYKKDLKNKNIFKNSKFESLKIKRIFHFAGQAGVKHSTLFPLKYVNDNILAFVNLLEFFKNKKEKPEIIFASSSSVYGESYNKISNLSFTPKSIYAVSKFTMELIANVYCNSYKFKVCGLRFFTVYGNYGRPDMSYFIFAKKILLNKMLDVYNKGVNSRSFTHITDLIININKVTNHLRKQKKGYFNTFNIGNPKSYKINYLLKLLEKNFLRKAKVNYIALQKWDIVKTKSNIKRENKILKLKFNVNLEDGIKDFVNWFKTYEK